MNSAQRYLGQLIERDKAPCVSYHLFDKEKTIYQFSSGFAHIGEEQKISDKTTFNAFSVTKTFTALAILQLAEQKKLKIDESAKYYLSDFPYSSAITIRHLLTHSSGIPNPIPLRWIHLTDEHTSFDRNQFFDPILVKYYKTKFNTNEKFSYSNLGYVLLGRIIENVAKVNFEQYITDNIIKRLELQPNDLDFIINDANAHARGYVKQVSFTNILLSFLIDKSKYMAKAEGKWKPFKSYYVNGTSYGGLIGTPGAFVKYMQELIKQDCRLLSNKYKELLFTENFTRDKRATGMCMSWFTGKLEGRQYFAHAGGGGGYYCEVRLYPDYGIGSVIMFNRTGMGDERFLNSVDKYFITKN